MDVYAGFEGGGSSGLVVLLDSKGGVLAEESCDKCTNLLTVGYDKCGTIISELTSKAKSKCGLKPDTLIKAMGLALSGADDQEDCKSFQQHLQQHFSSLSSHYEVYCDTVGSIATVSAKGGLVLIAGTGSSCLLSNPDGSTHRCGGWGHMLGDEGSAFWISRKCVKTYFDHVDNMAVCPYDITNVQNIIFKYFNITDRFQMLGHLYSTFSKKFFAGLCGQLAADHTSSKDALIEWFFHQGGLVLAQHVIALIPHAHQSLLDQGLDVLCIGSVWKSWQLLKPGFLEAFGRAGQSKTGGGEEKSFPKKLRLLRCLKPSTHGAAFLGAKAVGVCLDVKHANNFEVFYEHTFP